MIDREILQSLQTAALYAVAASSIPTLPLKFAGVAFATPNDQKYLELVMIPNNRTDDFWGDEKNYQGLFRLVLHWPNNGAGAYQPVNVLASIAAYFAKSRRLGEVQIVSAPDFGGVLEQGGENLFPATLRYQRFSG